MNEQLTISGHPDSFYNGAYVRVEDWNGHPHFLKSNSAAHLYFYATNGMWLLDNNQQFSQNL